MTKKLLLSVCMLLFFSILVNAQSNLNIDKPNFELKSNEFNVDTIVVVGETHLDEFANVIPAKVFTYISDGTCHLKSPIKVKEDGILIMNGKNKCKTLRLHKDSYIKVKGSLKIYDMLITSWDPETNDVIHKTEETFDEIRPFITTTYPSHDIEIKNSEISHLGFYKKELGGSKWGLSLYGTKNAEIDNNKFHHNYFGFYTYETENAKITNNEVYENIEYGLDFHDYSNNFYVANNDVHHNRNHGIIFSKYCDNNQIIDNYVHDNTENVFVKGIVKNYGTHGIMIHLYSNNNVIKGNRLERNRIGIAIDRAKNTIIEDNIIENDLEDAFSIKASQDVLVQNNEVYGTEEYAIYIYDSKNVAVKNNIFEDTKKPIRIKNTEDYVLEGNTELDILLDSTRIKANQEPEQPTTTGEETEESSDNLITGLAVANNDNINKITGSAISSLGGPENFIYTIFISILVLASIAIVSYVVITKG